jgi:hypothetical protein
MKAEKGIWYAAHIIMFAEFKDGVQDKYPVMENVVLIHAKTEEEAFAKAEAIGKEDEGDSDGTFKWEERPARLVFGGIRKLIECVDEEQQPADGTEVTYSFIEVANKESLDKIVRGDPVQVLYEE